jgi:hypothetical protein
MASVFMSVSDRFRSTTEKVGILGEQCQEFCMSTRGIFKSIQGLTFMTEAGEVNAARRAHIQLHAWYKL